MPRETGFIQLMKDLGGLLSASIDGGMEREAARRENGGGTPWSPPAHPTMQAKDMSNPQMQNPGQGGLLQGWQPPSVVGPDPMQRMGVPGGAAYQPELPGLPSIGKQKGGRPSFNIQDLVGLLGGG